MSGAVDTLFLPMASGDIAPPASGQRLAFLNASVPAELPKGLAQSALICEQGFRPQYLALQRAGYEVVPELAKEKFSGALVLAGKHKSENQAMVTRACRIVAPGGTVVVAGDKTLGIQPLRKWVGDRVDIEGSLAKHHATAFWFAAAKVDAFPELAEDRELVEGRFETAPGMFSHGKPDPGSVMLAEHFHEKIKGSVADFGCGWGYLSASLLEKGRPERLSLFEAHYASLEAAKRNLARLETGVPVHAWWSDLTSEPVARQFDWVVMNPPFHAARASEPDIGKAFIDMASKALLPGGRLLMVANRKLPYEQALARGFRRVEEKTVRDGFKIVEAVR